MNGDDPSEYSDGDVELTCEAFLYKQWVDEAPSHPESESILHGALLVDQNGRLSHEPSEIKAEAGLGPDGVRDSGETHPKCIRRISLASPSKSGNKEASLIPANNKNFLAPGIASEGISILRTAFGAMTSSDVEASE